MVLFVLNIVPPLSFRISPLDTRTSLVEAAGGGAVRANSSNGVKVQGFILRKLQNPGARASSLSQLEGQGEASTSGFLA